jgi:hypothetical protein
MPKILGIDSLNVSLTPNKVRGTIPLGGIFGLMNNITGSFSVPGVGAANGLIRCTGQAVPGGHNVTGTTPNISDSRFIGGNTTTGTNFNVSTPGGVNTVQLALANMPPHAHPASLAGVNVPHVHPASTGTVSSGFHSHNTPSSNGAANAPHNHIMMTAAAVAPGPSVNVDYNTDASSVPFAHGIDTGGQLGAFHTHTHDVVAANAPHSHGASTDTSNAPHTHPASVGSFGAATAFSIAPQYITTVYVMRIS